MNLPESVKHLYGALYAVPFDLIEIPEPSEDATSYEFGNPRGKTNQGLSDLINSELSEVLREDIKNKGLMVPLICRYIEEEDKIQLVGGERRYRAISYLIENHESVKDCSEIIKNKNGKEYAWKNAGEVYANVPCQIYCTEDDLEALAYSYSENACRKNFNEGHDVALLLDLRKYNTPDDKILSILQKTKNWLSETDDLIQKLDPATLNDLLEGRINRLAAEKLSSIEDVSARTLIREDANKLTTVDNTKRKVRDEKRVARATKNMEIANIEQHIAEVDGNDENVKKAQKKVADASAKVADALTKQQENQRSTKGKDIDKAIRAKTGKSDVKAGIRSLSQVKIKNNYLDYLSRVQRNSCLCLEADPLFEIPENVEKEDVIKSILKVVKAIHDGDEDCSKVLKKCFPT